MDRRCFIALLSSAAAVLPSRGYAQPDKKLYRVAIVAANGPPDVKRELSITRAFLEGMRDLGYTEGENVAYEFRSAEGKVAERAGPMTEEFITKGVDVINVNASAVAKEFMRHTTKIPIVMSAGGDLVAQGIVASLARPGGNVTGFSNYVGPEIDAKRLQFLKEVAPTARRVAYFGTKQEWDSGNGQALQSAAQGLDLTVILVEHSLAGHAEAFQVLENERPDAFIVSQWTSLWVKRQAIFFFALQHRTPVVYPWREYVDAGGLMSYGLNLVDQYRRSAGYVDKILKGANPGELPIQLPTNFDLVINLKTAKAIGLEIPAHLLAQAAEVIE
jgi:putative tryptophan/tyrosine transport system substrate-binding protein